MVAETGFNMHSKWVDAQMDGVTDDCSVSSLCIAVTVDGVQNLFRQYEHSGSKQGADFLLDIVKKLVADLHAKGAHLNSLVFDNEATNRALKAKMEVRTVMSRCYGSVSRLSASRCYFSRCREDVVVSHCADWNGRICVSVMLSTVQADPVLARILTFGCVAHGLNLLTGDFLSIDVIDEFMEQLVTGLKEFRQKKVHPRLVTTRKHRNDRVQLEHDLVPHMVRELSLPGATRWTTNWRCVRHTRENEQSLKVVIASAAADADLDKSFSAAVKVIHVHSTVLRRDTCCLVHCVSC